jgi:hypothetical protein
MDTHGRASKNIFVHVAIGNFLFFTPRFNLLLVVVRVRRSRRCCVGARPTERAPWNQSARGPIRKAVHMSNGFPFIIIVIDIFVLKAARATIQQGLRSGRGRAVNAAGTGRTGVAAAVRARRIAGTGTALRPNKMRLSAEMDCRLGAVSTDTRPWCVLPIGMVAACRSIRLNDRSHGSASFNFILSDSLDDVRLALEGKSVLLCRLSIPSVTESLSGSSPCICLVPIVAVSTSNIMAS